MLVLSRKTNESIAIGDEITLKVLRTSGNRVTLGIDAPPHVHVSRREIVIERDEGTVPSWPATALTVR